MLSILCTYFRSWRRSFGKNALRLKMLKEATQGWHLYSTGRGTPPGQYWRRAMTARAMTSRLSLQALEARDVPATLHWLGGDSFAPTSIYATSNWDIGRLWDFTWEAFKQFQIVIN